MAASTVIVAGSKGLIGSATTDYLSKAGFKVLELDIQLGHDLADEKFVKEWFSKNKADALVNLFALNDHVDAGRKSSRFLEVSLDSFGKYLNLNLTALFSVCREFIRNNAKGAIVNFTSTYGLVSPLPKLYGGDEKHIGYGVSKAGVVQLTRHLAVHAAPKFRVNCIAPGGVKNKQNEEFQKEYGAMAPLGRMMDLPELMGMIEFLASEKSSYCTGGVYCVDGGWTAW